MDMNAGCAKLQPLRGPIVGEVASEAAAGSEFKPTINIVFI